MSDRIWCNCPECGKECRFRSEYAGDIGVCSKCEAEFTIPTGKRRDSQGSKQTPQAVPVAVVPVAGHTNRSSANQARRGCIAKALELCKQYGGAAKFATRVIFGFVPGGAALLPFVEEAFDAVQKSAPDEWEIDLAKQVKTTAENQKRLEEMLEIIGTDLRYLFAQIASLEQMPKVAKQMLATAQAHDARCKEAFRKLDNIAHRFDRLEAQNRRILKAQQATKDVIAEEIQPRNCQKLTCPFLIMLV